MFGRASMLGHSKSGLTLIEVLIATLILGLGITALMHGFSNCLRMMKASKEFADAEWVLSLGELKYPIRETANVAEDLKVDPDSLDSELPDALRDRGYKFERIVDEKPDDDTDKLYVVRTRVTWGDGSTDNQFVEEVVRYVWEQNK